MKNILLKLFITSSFFFTSFAFSQGPGHFALECNELQIIEVETYEMINIPVPVRLNDDRHKGSYIFINYSVADVKNAGSTNPDNRNGVSWLGGIIDKNDLSKVKFIDEYFPYHETNDDFHVFERWNKDVYLNTKKRKQQRFWGREKLSVDREKLEVNTHLYFQRKNEDGEIITNDYKNKFTSCRIINADAENSLLDKLNDEWTSIKNRKLEIEREKQRLEEERVKAKNKI
tara:strand:+ start:70 stop:759 length:690 start_codon:yes stop_codon:yes gene_type:complete